MYGLSWTPDGQEIVYDVDEPQPVGYGESTLTAPHLLEDRRLPTSRRRP